MTKFELTEQQESDVDKIKLKHKCDTRGFSYIFYLTGIGLACTVKCNCGTSWDISEYDKW